MKNKMNIAEWARLNEMSPEEFNHEIVLTMAGIGSMDLSKMDNNADGITYHCGFDEFSYEVTVKKM